MSELESKRKHLESLETFIESPAYKGYLAAVEHDIADLREAVINVEPIDRPSEIENFKLRGELRCLESRKTLFEDARVTLKNRIDELVERDIQNATNTKV